MATRQKAAPAPASPLARAAPATIVVFVVIAVLSPVAAAGGAFALAVMAFMVGGTRARARTDSVSAKDDRLDHQSGVEDPVPMTTTVILWNVRLFVLATSLSAQSTALSFLALALLVISTLVAVLVRSDDGGGRHFPVPLLVLVLGASSSFVWILDPPSRYLVLGVLALFVIAWAAALFEDVRAGLAMAAFDAVGIYLVASTVAHFVLGLRPARFIELANTVVGPFDVRITFPFSSGPTASAGMAGAYIAGYLAMVRGRLGAGRVLRALCLSSAVVVALASNGRVALLSAAVVGVTAYLSPRLLTRTAVPAMLVMLFLPLWWPAIDSAPFPAAARTWLSSQPFLDRGEGGKTVETLSSRTRVWDGYFESYEELPLARKVFGYGARGHVTSGVSRSYAAIFATYDDPRAITPHSTVLQQAVDAGLVGVVVLLVVLVRSATRLGRGWRQALSNRATVPALGCLAMLVVFAAAAATDSSLAPGGHQEQFWATLLIVCVASLYRPARDVEVIQE